MDKRIIDTYDTRTGEHIQYEVDEPEDIEEVEDSEEEVF